MWKALESRLASLDCPPEISFNWKFKFLLKGNWNCCFKSSSRAPEAFQDSGRLHTVTLGLQRHPLAFKVCYPGQLAPPTPLSYTAGANLSGWSRNNSLWLGHVQFPIAKKTPSSWSTNHSLLHFLTGTTT